MAKKTLTIKRAAAAAAVPGDAPTFEIDGKKFKVTKGAIIRFNEGMRELTAADIAASEEAQKYCVENKCSCVEEVA